jgi:hypothetical protein
MPSYSYVERYKGVLNGNIASTSTGTGTLVVTGGIGTNGRVSANDVVISATTASTSTSTGALTISGGVGVAGNVYIGGNTASTSTGTGTLVITGGLGVSGTISAGSLSISSLNSTPIGNATASTGAFTTLSSSGATTMTVGTASTSTSTGSLVVTGGVGVSGAVYSATHVLTGGTASTSTSTGSLVVTGGVGVSGRVSADNVQASAIQATAIGNVTAGTGAFTSLSSSGATTMTAGTASTSTASGTLVVTGGVGVSGRLSAQNLTVADQFNTGVTLATDSWSSARISVRSELRSLKSLTTTQIFTVPTGYMFLIDTMEIITTARSGAAAEAPFVSFGTSAGTTTDYYGPTQVTSNSPGARHIIENPQDGAAAGTVITFTVTTASTATIHTGAGIVTGYLLKLS